MILALWKWWHGMHGVVGLKGSPHDRYYRCDACGATRDKPTA
jgi:hypothetical protein